MTCKYCCPNKYLHTAYLRRLRNGNRILTDFNTILLFVKELRTLSQEINTTRNVLNERILILNRLLNGFYQHLRTDYCLPNQDIPIITTPSVTDTILHYRPLIGTNVHDNLFCSIFGEGEKIPPIRDTTEDKLSTKMNALVSTCSVLYEVYRKAFVDNSELRKTMTALNVTREQLF